MKHHYPVSLAVLCLIVSGCAVEEDVGATGSLAMEGEVHLSNVRQLTSGGENAEAYWAFDGSQLIYQARKPGAECDQIYVLDPESGDTRMVSTGEGRTTCSYFYPSGNEILYSSTHHHNSACPENPDFSMGSCGLFTRHTMFLLRIWMGLGLDN